MQRTVLVLLLTGFTTYAEEPDTSVAALRETISKIVDTQTLESKERTDWESRKAEFAALLELHRKEIALLAEELEKAGQSAPGHGASADVMKAEIESLKAAAADKDKP